MNATTVLGLIFLAGLAIAGKPLPTCGPKERLELCNVCPQPSCQHPDIPNKHCLEKCLRPGCVCAEGYYRDDRPFMRSEMCVTKDICDRVN